MAWARKITRVTLLLVAFVCAALAQDLKSRLSAARSTDDIVRHYQKFKVIGTPRSKLLRSRAGNIFVTWYEPRRDLLFTEFQAYFQRDKKGYLFLGEGRPARDITVAVSPENKLVFLSGGKSFFSRSLDEIHPIYQHSSQEPPYV